MKTKMRMIKLHSVLARLFGIGFSNNFPNYRAVYWCGIINDPYFCHFEATGVDGDTVVCDGCKGTDIDDDPCHSFLFRVYKPLWHSDFQPLWKFLLSKIGVQFYRSGGQNKWRLFSL